MHRSCQGTSTAACTGSCPSCNGVGVTLGAEAWMEQGSPATTWTACPAAAPGCPCLISCDHGQDPAAVWLLGDPLQNALLLLQPWRLPCSSRAPSPASSDATLLPAQQQPPVRGDPLPASLSPSPLPTSLLKHNQSLTTACWWRKGLCNTSSAFMSLPSTPLHSASP